jgi:CRP/FNR family transcriptional regulator
MRDKIDAAMASLPPGLAGIGRRREARADSLLFQQDEPAASCFYVESGEIAMRRISRGGSEIEIARAGPGEWCGEVILFAGNSYPAQAVATRDSRVVEFRRADILGKAEPEVSAFFLSLLARKCLKLNGRIEQLTIMDSRERLARYVLGLCPGRASACSGGGGPCSIPLPKKKREIAAELGMTPETLSRALRQMQDEGYIRIDGPRIEVPSCDRLLELVENPGE